MNIDVEKMQRDKVLWMEIQNLPRSSYDGAYISTDMVIAICNSGLSHSYFDMQPVCFQPKDISVMLPGHIISNGENTDDYSALLIIISQSFYDEFINRDSFRKFYKYRYKPCCHLNDEEFRRLEAILNALTVVIDSRHPKRLSMIAEMLDVFFYELTFYRGDNSFQESTGNGVLFQHFYDLLITNHMDHHDVAWYADKLNLTPKYFSTTIRKTTGRSAGEWISNILSLKAKSLINTRYDLSLQEIGSLLGFANASTFCRFFRRMNLMSPKQFRES